MTLQEFWTNVNYHAQLPFIVEDVDLVQEDGLIVLNDGTCYAFEFKKLPTPEDYLPEIVKNNQSEFINWCEWWHGSHHDSQCEVYSALKGYKNGQGTLLELFEAVKETDDGFAESFKTHLNNKVK